MQLAQGYHLTYCTNIHPGETWKEVFLSLKQYLPPLKKDLSPDKPFGIGLRLSNLASKELLEGSNLQEFKVWLSEENLYVFTMNGFPYGGFHHQEVKDDVHKPDWTTEDRVKYTIRLANILAELLPSGMEGGISTSPLSYKPWLLDADETKMNSVYTSCTQHLLQVVEALLEIKQRIGKQIHIDIEPEPDGLLENSDEVISYYDKWLLPRGIKRLQKSEGFDDSQAREAIYQHLQLCYDVCHFALAYEKPSEAFAKLKQAGIKIGKIQLSAALKTKLPEDVETRGELAESFATLAESTYLHQVVERSDDGELTQYPDLTFALQHIRKPNAVEWRTHFHVPLFTEQYNGLQSTQEDVTQVLQLLRKEQITQHLEVETYTWEVLPEEIKTDLPESIKREMQWVLQSINNTNNAEDSSSERGRAHEVSHR
ncbi:metabolite traffic protein EboE [Pontibacter cellulosilyticus]|uniref:Metabolite traffic protein EboE n=1 Tax=Pontibacter cellulosilyticus TaxID=1720253 RepID=A0A923N2X7_9BACT|nr:metabolite traffic protein EboE [Pontibacter cellulosilyticus]MBC5991263.1 metabolite traffic protein EboE [Pontibacter cellulosilyticus]